MELLELLDDKDIRSTAQLAEKLGITVGMVEARLAHYERLGYVKRTIMGASDCTSDCKKCKGCTNCQNEHSVVFWEKKK